MLKMRQGIFRVADLVTLKMQVAQCTVFLPRDHPFKTYAFFPEELQVPTPSYTHENK